MKENMGLVDKIIRIAAALAISGLFITKKLTAGWAMSLLVLGGILLFTSVLGFCPLYKLLGMNSCRNNPNK